MTTQKNLSLQDVDIITTISESDKAKVCLVSVRSAGEPDIQKRDGNTLAVLKRYPGGASLGCYEQIAALQSAFFPVVYGLWEENGETFLLEEYISGMTLQEKLDEKLSLAEKPDADAILQETEVTDFGYQIAQALHVLHNATPPIIHRDIKPENIILAADGKIKLIDFDAAREYKPRQERDTVMLGTKEYASPEQFGFMQTDIRSDIYSWGIVFAELLAHANVSRGYAARARKIVDRATMFDPEKRYVDTEQLLRDLQRLSKISPIGISVVAGIAGLVLVGGVAAAIWQGSAQEVSNQGTYAGTEQPALVQEESESQENLPAQTSPESKNSKPDIESAEPVSLAEAYEYVSIEKELMSQVEILMETRPDLYGMIPFEDNDSGMYMKDQETVIGKEYVALRFLKSYPRDIVICDARLGELAMDSVYYYPYLEELGLNGNKTTLDESDYTLKLGNVVSISAEYLQTLEPGAYTFFVETKSSERSLKLGFYLIVHDKEEDVTNFRVHVLNEIAYYSSESENDVVFYVNNTPCPIEEIRVGNKVLGAGDYELVDDGFGVVFHPEFLKKYESVESLDMVIKMSNGKMVTCRVIYLQHF